MPKSDPYFQLPLCLLSMPLSRQDLVQQITQYCLVVTGEKIKEKLSESIIIEREERLYQNFDDCDSDDLNIIIASNRFGYNLKRPPFPDIKEGYNKAETYINEYESEYGKDAYIRVRIDIFNMLRSGTMPERKFRILVGLYSVIGNKKYSAVTYEQIKYRSMGYKSRSVFESEVKAASRKPLYSERQIGLTIGQLEIEGWFTSFRPNNRKKYYSIRLSLEALAKVLAEALSFKEFKSDALINKKRILLKEYFKK